MSSNINRVMLSGGLTRDPDYRQTGSGTGVLTFGIAVNDRRRDPQSGEWKEYPNFVDCTMFGRRADALSTRLRKGMKVAIEGKLRYSTWERDGQKRSKLEVAVDELEFMERQQKQPQSDAQRIRDEQAQYVQATYYDSKQQGGFFDDDCPF